jgi:hypothetical protein
VTAPPTGPARTTPLARNRYEEGQILRARDLERESDYFLARDRQHNGLAHGYGILLGLELVATEAGSEKPVTEADLSQSGPKPIDLAMKLGAAIDGLGRLLVVSRRVAVSRDLATLPSVLPPDTYRLELVYRHGATRRGTVTAGPCDEGSRAGVVEEIYKLRLTRFDPANPEPALDLGAVLDGPVDNPNLESPILIGAVEWSGTAWVGYSTRRRVYAPVQAQRVHAPHHRAEVELFDGNARLAVRFAQMPAPGAPDPFTPGPMQDRLRIDEEGAVWVAADASVGPDGIGFRRESDPANPENSRWRIQTLTSDPGAQFGLDPAGNPLAVGAYAPGNRELRVLFQREGSDTGKHRVVIGHVDENGGAFEPALVIYDRPKQGEGTGDATVDVWGDLHVRGTAWLNAAARRPTQPGPGIDELDMLLRQLAGPFAGAFRVFLTSDAQWLQDFAAAMAAQIAQPGGVRTAFINALVADAGFVNAVTTAAVGQAVAQAVPQAVAAVQNPANVPGLVAAITSAIDTPAAGDPALPQDFGSALLAALYRRLLSNNPVLKNQIIASVPAGEQASVTTALQWLP